MPLHARPLSAVLAAAVLLALGCSAPPPPAPTDAELCAAAACAPDAACTVTAGVASCACKAGFHGDGKTCQKTATCDAPDACPAHSTCRVDGDAIACDCEAGFQKSADATGCEKIDPCAAVKCGANASCVAGEGSTSCACNDGYYQEDDGSCQPVKVCTTCGANAHCTKVKGGAVCTCDSGYADASGACLDVDECASGAVTCGDHSHCQNTQGSYTCACETGFAPNASGACADVDECAQGACGPNSTCHNTEGSYACGCQPGYAVDGTGACADIDECAAGAVCGPYATCRNSAGSFSCACPAGTRPNGLGCEVLWTLSTGNRSLSARGPTGEVVLEIPLTATMSLGDMRALAVQPITGTLWTVAQLGGQAWRLAHIDPATGMLTPVGTATVDAELSALAFRPNGTLYGVSDNRGTSARTLYSFDLSTGAGTALGQLPEFPEGVGLAARSDTDELFAAAGSNQIGTGATADGWYFAHVDAATAQSTFLPITYDASTVVPDTTSALTWDAVGQRFLLATMNEVLTIDPTGAMTDLFQAGDAVTGIAFGPVPVVDECASGTDDCSATTVCQDRAFGYECVGAVPTTCAQVKAQNPAAPSGTYQLDFTSVGGGLENASCDMTTDGGGWTLIVRGGQTPQIPSGAPTATGVGFMPVDRMKAVAAHSHEVAFREAGDPNNWVRTNPLLVTPTPIANLRQGNSPYVGPWQYRASEWIGGGILANPNDHLWFDCGADPSTYVYPTVLYWACDNGGGFHWLEDHSTWDYNSQPDTTLELWLR